jgi:hypothetical protein
VYDDWEPVSQMEIGIVCREVEMKGRVFAGVAAVAFGLIFTATLSFSQTQSSQTQGYQTEGPGAKPGLPGWFLGGSAPDPGGRAMVGPGGVVVSTPGGRGGRGGGRGGFVACTDDIAKYCAGQMGGAARSCLSQNSSKLSEACKTELAALPPPAEEVRPPCSRSPVCGNRIAGGGSGAKGRVEWKQTMGYTPTYPYELPAGGGGVSAVGLDSKGNLWAFQRNAVGKPQLFKFSPDHKIILTVDDEVITHQYKAHGMKIDSEDNVWICDADGATIRKISPQGKLLLTIGERGHRGDWNEAKGQRLLWQPVHVDFGSNGDVFIFEGHANESPNDTDSGDPTDSIGAARVIHLDKNLKFINQWYGNSGGPGKFAQTHGSAVDPKTGEVWIGDREEYRIVVYTPEGKFLRTIQMRNLVCALYFDKQGQPWMGSGQDGQFLKIDRDGNVLGAMGNGMGMGPGQLIEASYFVMDAQGNLLAGDTSVGRITEFVAPKM